MAKTDTRFRVATRLRPRSQVSVRVFRTHDASAELDSTDSSATLDAVPAIAGSRSFTGQLPASSTNSSVSTSGNRNMRAAIDEEAPQRQRCQGPRYVVGQLISAGAVCPVVIRAGGHRAQLVVRGQDELSGLVAGQLWMVLHQACGYLSPRHLPNPQSPAHLGAVFEHRRIPSGDSRRPCGGQEVLRCGGWRYRARAGRCGQTYCDDGSNGTDENLFDHDNPPLSIHYA